jgi:hypothetical protein
MSGDGRLSEGCADELDRRYEIPFDKGCGNAHGAIARLAEMNVTERIEMNAAAMPGAIYFHDETRRTRGEVRDVTTDDDLTPEYDAETAAAQLRPEPLFGRRLVAAHAVGASFELDLALGGLATLIR